MTKGLEALKRIRQETIPATYIPDFDKNECCDIIEKELKAFEIIKNYNWFSFNAKRGFVVFCNDIMDIADEEEFNLLKEVLCNESI